MDVNTMEIKMPKADGKEFSFLSEEHIDSSYLETFNFDSKNQYIETTTREFCVSFRNVGIYQEAATKRIYDDLKSLLTHQG